MDRAQLCWLRATASDRCTESKKGRQRKGSAQSQNEMAEPWIRDAAHEFWIAARQSNKPFPRDLESAIAWVLPLALLKVPHLWVRHVQAALAQRLLPFPSDFQDRPLHGCICAYSDRGLIIVDGADPADELRFTLAHELAHFVFDYRRPRARAIERFGIDISSVLDGLREPTANERVDAILSNTPIGFYGHFMHRHNSGGPTPATLASETHADAFALELLAPETLVRERLPRGFFKKPFEESVKSLNRVLVRHFDLPRHVATQHASRLCRLWLGGPSVREWLGLT
jgi:Zn-dependent peptidase ImmA (M78 family)